MSTQQAAPSPGRANLALATLFSGMFVLGSAELLVVGVLNLMPPISGSPSPRPARW
jgi:DHA1 family inner membrane transport protein